MSTCATFSAWKYTDPDGEWWAWSCDEGEQHWGFPSIERALDDALQRHAHNGSSGDAT